MTDEQFCKLTEMIKTQNDMIARIGLILVRMTWLLVVVILLQILTWFVIPMVF
jgi:antibiotic biosynthesis monooxygenase (ABM) superfamily enzyme